MPDTSIDSDRRGRLLDTALAVFARYGFRKTSMEEVARAADISRQGLYLHFRDKEALFRAAIGRMLETGVAAVDAELARDAPIGPRLYGAMKAWYGRSVGTPAQNADELFARSVALLGDVMERSGAEVARKLEASIAASPLAARLAERGLSPADAALTLEACGLGLKHAGLTREAFKARLAAAVSLAVGAPVRPV
ncbi:MAG TPA: helix-turn-helix domain-containing protein [Caulobacteraceae bacterium]|nr:helix-turn-helix domain-containing protein [Caulobacteraceae bacterium]